MHTNAHTHTRVFMATFPGKSGLAACPIDNLTRAVKFIVQMPILMPVSRNTLGFTLSASTMTPEGEWVSLPFALLSDASAHFSNANTLQYYCTLYIQCSETLKH